jgi:crotonobetainyl-CoA:carnitine CoA-transferase CaiB-like acyl-CoA transferase
MSGLMGVTGEPGRAPAKSGGPVCDINAGVLGALGVVSAYVHRLKTGEGQLVETSLFEAGIQQMYWQAAIYFATGEVSGPTGSAHILSAPTRRTGSACAACSAQTTGSRMHASAPTPTA